MNKNNNIETFLNTNGIMREHAIVKLNSNPDLIKKLLNIPFPTIQIHGEQYGFLTYILTDMVNRK
jgi:hypothetical protein